MHHKKSAEPLRYVCARVFTCVCVHDNVLVCMLAPLSLLTFILIYNLAFYLGRAGLCLTRASMQLSRKRNLFKKMQGSETLRNVSVIISCQRLILAFLKFFY